MNGPFDLESIHRVGGGLGDSGTWCPFPFHCTLYDCHTNLMIGMSLV